MERIDSFIPKGIRAARERCWELETQLSSLPALDSDEARRAFFLSSMSSVCADLGEVLNNNHEPVAGQQELFVLPRAWALYNQYHSQVRVIIGQYDSQSSWLSDNAFDYVQQCMVDFTGEPLPDDLAVSRAVAALLGRATDALHQAANELIKASRTLATEVLRHLLRSSERGFGRHEGMHGMARRMVDSVLQRQETALKASVDLEHRCNRRPFTMNGYASRMEEMNEALQDPVNGQLNGLETLGPKALQAISNGNDLKVVHMQYRMHEYTKVMAARLVDVICMRVRQFLFLDLQEQLLQDTCKSLEGLSALPEDENTRERARLGREVAAMQEAERILEALLP